MEVQLHNAWVHLSLCSLSTNLRQCTVCTLWIQQSTRQHSHLLKLSSSGGWTRSKDPQTVMRSIKTTQRGDVLERPGGTVQIRRWERPGWGKGVGDGVRRSEESSDRRVWILFSLQWESTRCDGNVVGGKMAGCDAIQLKPSSSSLDCCVGNESWRGKRGSPVHSGEANAAVRLYSGLGQVTAGRGHFLNRGASHKQRLDPSKRSAFIC